MAKFVVFAFAVLVFPFGLAVAGIGTITGRESEGWTSGYFNVIVGRVTKIERVDPASLEYRAVVEPIATLAGRFDPSERPKMTFRFYAGEWATSIQKPPPEGALVIAVVHLNRLHRDEKTRSDWISSSICKFMPGDAGLVVITGLDDPRVLETLRKLQDARAHRNPSPYPTTRPSSATPQQQDR